MSPSRPLTREPLNPRWIQSWVIILLYWVHQKNNPVFVRKHLHIENQLSNNRFKELLCTIQMHTNKQENKQVSLMPSIIILIKTDLQSSVSTPACTVVEMRDSSFNVKSFIQWIHQLDTNETLPIFVALMVISNLNNSVTAQEKKSSSDCVLVWSWKRKR